MALWLQFGLSHIENQKAVTSVVVKTSITSEEEGKWMRYLNAVWDERQDGANYLLKGDAWYYFRTGFTAPSRHAEKSNKMLGVGERHDMVEASI